VAAVDAAGTLDRPKIRELTEGRFTVAAMVDKYVEVYRRVMESRT
jgi:hypothetical protein